MNGELFQPNYSFSLSSRGPQGGPSVTFSPKVWDCVQGTGFGLHIGDLVTKQGDGDSDDDGDDDDNYYSVAFLFDVQKYLALCKLV